MQTLLSEQTLSRLDVAFSRDQDKKIYVQDRMQEHGAELYNWLQHNASIYVCGDAKQMAVSVDKALAEIIAKHGKLSADEARKFLAKMINDKRYIKDVY